MELKTPRLFLRKFHLEDLAGLIEEANNLNILKFLHPIPYPVTEEFTREWLRKCEGEYEKSPQTVYPFAIELSNEGKLIGGIELREVSRYSENATIGYWLGENHWKNGYASEAVEKVVDFGVKDLNLVRINAEVDVQNTCSSRLLEKLGFVHEGRKEKFVRVISTGELADYDLYGWVVRD
ncbi:MAG: GNAT family protein [archaeon]